MPDQTTILTWGCMLLGAWLAGYAIYSVKVGRTRGYYADHRYARGEDAGFERWVWLRLVLGLVCLAVGLLVL